MLRRYWRIYTGVAVACAAGAVLDALHVAVLLPLLNTMLRQPAASQGRLYAALDRALASLPFGDPLTASASLLILLALVKGPVGVLIEYMIGRGAGTVLYDTKRRILEKYAVAPYRFFVETKQGDLLHQVLMAPIRLSFVLTRFPQFVVEVVRALAIVALLFMTNAYATLGIVVLGAGLQLLIGATTKRTTYGLGKGRSEADKAQTHLLQEFISGIKQITVFGVKRRWLRLFDESSYRYSELFVRDQAVLAVPRNLIEIVTTATLFGVIVYWQHAHPEKMIEFLPLAGVFAMALFKLLPALSTISRTRLEVLGALPYIESVHEALEMDWDPEPEGKLPFSGMQEGFILDKVGFGYPGRARLLVDVDLEIRAQKTTAIVGGSGSGKTTIINLLLGLYRPDSGSVLIDGTPLDAFDKSSLFRRIALVSQDTCILHASVRDNILFGRTGYSGEDVERAARIAHASEFIEALPEGYETLVGERGMRLSGGQQQRLAIARAVLGDPDVLIFDEATSALDNVSEAAVQRAIRDASRDKTVIQIAHRLSSVQSADKIVVLQAGRIVEQGTHSELASHDGAYARLLRRGEPI